MQVFQVGTNPLCWFRKGQCTSGTNPLGRKRPQRKLRALRELLQNSARLPPISDRVQCPLREAALAAGIKDYRVKNGAEISFHSSTASPLLSKEHASNIVKWRVRQKAFLESVRRRGRQEIATGEWLDSAKCLVYRQKHGNICFME